MSSQVAGTARVVARGALGAQAPALGLAVKRRAGPCRTWKAGWPERPDGPIPRPDEP